jgi:ATP-dependent DNA helicase DinG
LPAGDPAFAGGHISTHLGNLREAIGRIEANLEWVKDEDICRMLKVQARTRERLKITLSDLAEQGETLRAIAGTMVSENRLAAYEVFLRHWSLISQEVDVAELIRMNLYSDTRGIVYTSATLCQDGSFDPFKGVAGLDRPFFLDEQMTRTREFRFVSLPSPFAEDALETIVPPDAVGGNYRNKGVWLEAVTRLLPGLILKNRGRTLVLFSSYRDLEAVADRIAGEITAAGFPLLIQQSGYPTGNLCDEFRAIKESVLFGVDTFWYGVDFKGDTLTQVIITRIPYASPADPLQRSRRRMMSPADYRQRYLYDTYIKLKQGIGRLIRCETDRGRVVILDSRYPLFREQTSLPGGPAGDGKGKDSPGNARAMPASPPPVLREIQSSFIRKRRVLAGSPPSPGRPGPPSPDGIPSGR